MRQPTISEIRDDVLRAVTAKGPLGLRQIADVTGHEYGTVQRRLRELIWDGKVEITGSRASGKQYVLKGRAPQKAPKPLTYLEVLAKLNELGGDVAQVDLETATGLCRNAMKSRLKHLREKRLIEIYTKSAYPGVKKFVRVTT